MSNDKLSDSRGRVIALVPARAGSKGVPGKNSRILFGKPLLGLAIETAKRIEAVDRVVLSTDSPELASIGLAFGAEVPFLRPPELANDSTPMLAVVQHAVRALEEQGDRPEIIVLLQPSAPFRRVKDITAALDILKNTPAADSVVSVELVPPHYRPAYVMVIENGRLLPFLPDGIHLTRRQDAPPVYTRSGQFYIVRRSTLIEKQSIYGDYTIPFITTHRAVNIDTLEDWESAERLAKELSQECL
jgi:CMP-N,N'-diacetyllegionaminic acid synthase